MRRPPTIVNQKPAVYYDLPLHFHYEAVERQTKPLQINPLWRQIVKILSKMSPSDRDQGCLRVQGRAATPSAIGTRFSYYCKSLADLTADIPTSEPTGRPRSHGSSDCATTTSGVEPLYRVKFVTSAGVCVTTYSHAKAAQEAFTAPRPPCTSRPPVRAARHRRDPALDQGGGGRGPALYRLRPTRMPLIGRPCSRASNGSSRRATRR